MTEHSPQPIAPHPIPNVPGFSGSQSDGWSAALLATTEASGQVKDLSARRLSVEVFDGEGRSVLGLDNDRIERPAGCVIQWRASPDECARMVPGDRLTVVGKTETGMGWVPFFCGLLDWTDGGSHAGV